MTVCAMVGMEITGKQKMNGLNSTKLGGTAWHSGSILALYPAVPGSNLTAGKTNPNTFSENLLF